VNDTFRSGLAFSSPADVQAVDGHYLEIDLGCPFGQSPNQRRQDQRADIITGSNPKCADGVVRDERRRRQSAFQEGQPATDGGCEIKRPRRWQHPGLVTYEKFILQGVAQSVERMADRGRAEAEALGRCRHAARLHDGIEDMKQVEIDLSQVHGPSRFIWCPLQDRRVSLTCSRVFGPSLG
jgi:hypothetical protein